MLVSIITPSFNQGQYLEHTIQSVLNQTYSKIEYLIIDGGSTDNSIDIINKYQERVVYWVSEPDDGQADAINKGLRRAKGELICWINSDDILYPDFVATRVDQFKQLPNADMIYGDIEQGPDTSNKRIRKGGKTSIKNMLKYVECPIPQQSAMWKRDVVEKIGYLDPQWQVLLDREYFIRIAAKCSLKYLRGSVAFFRNHSFSKSVSDKLKWAEELPKYYEMVFDDNIYHLEPSLLAYRNKCLSKVYFKCARMYACAEKKDEAEILFSRLKKLSFYSYIFYRYLKRLF
jgi:glycosyltransferase involved in cell wall biosynthesis